MKVKYGECKKCEEEKAIYSKGLCQYCYWREKNSQSKSTLKRTPIKRKANFIKPISDKRAKDLSKYRPLRDKYLKENPVCEVKECHNKTTNLHHKKGRTGSLIYDVKYFMACCSTCHPQKIHFTDTQWAKDNGYLLNSK